jgi:hypothetical protein
MPEYDRSANERFQQEVRAWAAEAPDEVPPFPARPFDSDPRYSRSQANMDVGNMLLGPNASFILSAIEEHPDTYYIHFDGWRTPMTMSGNAVCVAGRVIGRLDPKTGLIYDQYDVPMSPRRFALTASESLDAAMGQVIFANEEAFCHARPERSSPARDLTYIHEDNQTLRVSYCPATKEVYVVRPSGEVELIADGLDEDEAKELALQGHSLADLRKAAASHSPDISLLQDIAGLEAAGPAVGDYSSHEID